MSAVSPKSLLIVEDNSDDLFFIQRLLGQIGKLELAEAVRDGESAIEYLQQRLPEPPRLVLLDLKLPRAHGFQVLEWIRSQPQLNETVVTILSSSPERRDIDKAQRLGAQHYLIKIPAVEELRQLISGVFHEESCPVETAAAMPEPAESSNAVQA